MKAIWNAVLALWLACLPLFARASEQAAELAPEPTVSVVWVGVFVALFVGMCVWFLIAMVRADRKNKAAENKVS
jgi:hypothetical protein